MSFLVYGVVLLEASYLVTTLSLLLSTYLGPQAPVLIHLEFLRLQSIASPYFKEMFVGNPAPHPVIMLRQTYAEELEAILQFIYNGQTHVHEEKLNDFLSAAKTFQVTF